MAWCQPGDKPLSEPMMVRLPTHICVTRSQWVNIGLGNGLVPSGYKPFSELMLTKFYDAKWRHHEPTLLAGSTVKLADGVFKTIFTE